MANAVHARIAEALKSGLPPSMILLDTPEASAFQGRSVRTMERQRVEGRGPRFMKLGKLVKYRLSDLLDEQESALRGSTSEAA